MTPEDKCKQISLFKKEGLQYAIAQVNNIAIANDLLKKNPHMAQSLPEKHKNYLNGITYMAGVPHYPVDQVIDFIISAGKTHSEIIHRQGDEVILTDQYMDDYLSSSFEK